MKGNNVIQKKSFDFAVRAVNAYKYLIENKKEYVLSKQFLKAATSIGANIEEAEGAQSKADFLAKISIAYKETRETGYWLELLEKSELIEFDYQQYLAKVRELIQILSSITKTLL